MAAEVILRFKSNWADEMDLDGLWIVDEAWWDSHKAKAVGCENWPLSCSIGTNEEVTFDSADDYLSSFHELSAKPDEIEIIKRLIGTQVGQVVTIDEGDFETYDDDYNGN